MNKTEINHPRVFDDREWAESYYRRQKFSISQMGKRLAGILTE